jgi:hypothetical protein
MRRVFKDALVIYMHIIGKSCTGAGIDLQLSGTSEADDDSTVTKDEAQTAINSKRTQRFCESIFCLAKIHSYRPQRLLVQQQQKCASCTCPSNPSTG